MCGLTGYFDPNHKLKARDTDLQRMIQCLKHRGPDDQGVWNDAQAGIGLGHRRLSIIDLSPEGHQPMVSACGRYVIAYNGEIYNYREIRRELVNSQERQLQWRGRSDTEVALAAISAWGLTAAIERFNGMFAFALWDRHERVLHLARDRCGEKPLYYGWVDGVFIFGSELKALRANSAWLGKIDRNALALYFRFNYIPTPFSIFHDIYKLPAASVLRIDAGVVARSGEFSPYIEECSATRVSPVAYWPTQNIIAHAVQSRLTGTETDIVDELEALLSDAVKLRMEADVPLGAFLSGGIDSSTITALMQKHSAQPIKTFSIGSFSRDYDEAVNAQAIADHLGTDHTQLYVSAEKAMQVIPRLPQLYDEPFADASQIPTFLVSELARGKVVVSLSGDGGDELFAGYYRHFFARLIWQKIARLSENMRQLSAKAITSLSPDNWDKMLVRLQGLFPESYRGSLSGNRMYKLAEVLSAASPELMYLGLITNWKDTAALVPGATEPWTAITRSERWPDLADFTERMMYRDLIGYLPDDILVKLDRASMAVSLESRVPYLDHRVVELSWRIPISMKIKNGRGKWVLREILYRHVPRALIDGPKKGFGLPIDEWLRGPLLEWATEMLDVNRMRDAGYLNHEMVHEEWRLHVKGRHNAHQKLWSVLMFQAWMAEISR